MAVRWLCVPFSEFVVDACDCRRVGQVEPVIVVVVCVVGDEGGVV